NELIGGKSLILGTDQDLPQSACQQIGNQLRSLALAAVGLDGMCQFWKSAGFTGDQPMQGDGGGRQRRAKNEAGQTLQNFRQSPAGKKRHILGGPDLVDDSMNDGGKKRRLVFEPIIKRAFGDSGASGDRFDRRRPIAFVEKQLHGNCEDSLPQQQGVGSRRATASSGGLGPLDGIF